MKYPAIRHHSLSVDSSDDGFIGAKSHRVGTARPQRLTSLQPGHNRLEIGRAICNRASGASDRDSKR
jgi:hypothetical protein